MKKKLTLAIFILIIGVIAVTGCSRSAVDIKGIEQIELSFSGEAVDSYSCVLTEKGNLKEAMILFKELETYQSPESNSKFEDVNYKITYEDGKVQERVYIKIRPVATVFSKIFKSKEVIKQWTN